VNSNELLSKIVVDDSDDYDDDDDDDDLFDSDQDVSIVSVASSDNPRTLPRTSSSQASS